ncbi:MAG: peptidyl-prolyl cis-trans isomerase [Pseudomonadota bacterium]
MLRAMRDGTKGGFLKYILLGFMAMAVGGLVLTDVGGFFRGGLGTNVVAKGKGIEIGIQEFDRTVRRVLARQGLAPSEAYRMGLIDQALRNEIQTRILAKEAQKIGIYANDTVVAQEIGRLSESLSIEGMTKSEALRTTLRSQGITEDEFVTALRNEISVTILTQAIATNARELPLEQAKALYQFQNEARDFEGIVLTHASVSDVEQPSEENLQKFYEARKIEFAIPEQRSITLATLKSDMVAKNVSITDEEAKAYYDQNIITYSKPERRTLEQAILKDQASAQEILNRIQDKNVSFEQAVEDVTESKDGYLGENAFGKDSLIEAVSEQVFAAEKGSFVGPVETPLGWNIVLVKDIIEPQVTPFEEVKRSIKDNLLNDRLADELIEAANTLDDQLASGEPLETLVSELGLTTESFSKITVSGTTLDGTDRLKGYEGDKAKILEAAFDYDIGESTPVMEMADGRFVVARIDEIVPLSYKPFEEVRSQIQNDWINEQKRLSNQLRASQMLQSIQGGMSLADAAKEAGSRIQTFTKLNRAEAKNPMTLPNIRQVFSAAQGETIQLNNNDGIIIGQVKNITLPDVEKSSDKIAELREQNSEYLAQEYLGQYLTALLNEYKVQINAALLQQVYGETPTS